MGKLVLYLADGTSLDIKLARERITIGRRADNDVCLPYPAVSGEHAAVVTILSDSFLEDLGSTNGTLVNGKPVAKHFLRDHDQIDIGRQKLVYVVDESEQPDAGPPSLGRRDAHIFGERVEPARPAPSVVVPEAEPVDEVREENEVFEMGSPSDIERFVAAELGTAREGIGAQSPSKAADPLPVAAAKPDTSVPAIRVLTGPSAGRELLVDKDEIAVGRVGVQVAAVRRTEAGLRLVPVEGIAPPRVNGEPVGAEGVPVRPGDRLQIAGIELEIARIPGDGTA